HIGGVVRHSKGFQGVDTLVPGGPVTDPEFHFIDRIHIPKKGFVVHFPGQGYRREEAPFVVLRKDRGPIRPGSGLQEVTVQIAISDPSKVGQQLSLGNISDVVQQYGGIAVEAQGVIGESGLVQLGVFVPLLVKGLYRCKVQGMVLVKLWGVVQYVLDQYLGKKPARKYPQAIDSLVPGREQGTPVDAPIGVSGPEEGV